jgi:hypothetical protein
LKRSGKGTHDSSVLFGKKNVDKELILEVVILNPVGVIAKHPLWRENLGKMAINNDFVVLAEILPRIARQDDR